jgi:hypothetical protein
MGGGAQQIVIQSGSESVTVPFGLIGCMVQCKHRLSLIEKVSSLN